MKPFVFRLESILQLRAREEARAQEAFEQAMRLVSQAELDLRTAREELGRMEKEICEQRGGRATGNDYVVFLNAARVRRELCEKLALRVDVVRKEMEKQRALFQAARRRHEAMIKLRERHRLAHAAIEQRREENAISDLIMSRHAMNAQAATSHEF